MKILLYNETTHRRKLMNERSLTQEIGIAVAEAVVVFVALTVIKYSYQTLQDRRTERKLKKWSEESA